MAYEIIVSEEVFTALNAVILYLEESWSKKIAEDFLLNFYEKVESLSKNPHIGRQTHKNPSIRKIAITKHNTLYYEIASNRIELLAIFFNAQNPARNKFE